MLVKKWENETIRAAMELKSWDEKRERIRFETDQGNMIDEVEEDLKSLSVENRRNSSK